MINPLNKIFEALDNQDLSDHAPLLDEIFTVLNCFEKPDLNKFEEVIGWA